MKLLVAKSKTSFLVCVFIQDSSSTVGAGLTGLTSGSASLVCYRARSDDGNAAGTQITLSGGTRGTWSSGGFVEKDATNMKGVYELGIPNAALATGSDYCVIVLSGATNMAPLALEIQLVNFDPDDAVRLGLTALPNVASGSAGAIPTTGTGSNQIDVDASGRVNLGKALGTAVTLDTNNVLNVSTKYIGGLIQTAGDIYPAVSNIAVTGAALNAVASSELLTTGSDAGGLANTNTLDGLFDSWTDAAGTIDGYYQFDVSATTGAVGVGVTWDGYLVGVVNTIKVYAFNWGSSGWDQLGSIVGIAGTVTMAQEWDLTSAHTGTGGNLGLVRIRFNAAGLTAATLKTDRILLGYAVVLSPAQIATGVWQDATSGDFTVASSIGKSLYIANIVPGAAGGHFIAGTNAATTITTGLTAHLIGTVDTVTTYTGNTPQTGDAYARLGAPAGASIAADIAEIEAETDAIQASTAGLTFTVAGQVDANVLTLSTSLRPGIRKNVALPNFEIMMTDSTNHNPTTGLTVVVTRSIDGGAFAAGTLGAVTELSNGFYKFDFAAGDLNGTVVTLRATAIGADDLGITIHTDP